MKQWSVLRLKSKRQIKLLPMNQPLVDPTSVSGPWSLLVGQTSSSALYSFSSSDSTDSESSSVLLPYLDDLVSDDLFLSSDFFLFSPSLSSSSSLPPFELESVDPLKLELLVMGPLEAGWEAVFGFSLFLELLLDELPELDALSLLESPAFCIILSWVELSSLATGWAKN